MLEAELSQQLLSMCYRVLVFICRTQCTAGNVLTYALDRATTLGSCLELIFQLR